MARPRFKTNASNPMPELVSQLKQHIASAGGNFVPKAATQSLISMESAVEGSQAAELDNTAHGLADMITATLSNCGLEAMSKDTVSVEAGVIAALAYGDPAAYAQRANDSNVVGGKDIFVVDSFLAGLAPPDYRAGVSASMEAFDDRNLKDFMPYSIAFNIYASRQDAFGEMFFPTTVVSPDQAGVDVTVGRMLVFNETHHALAGSPANFNKQNLLEASVDYTILGDEQTRVFPVVSSSPSNTAMFIPAALYTPAAITVAGATFNTAPLLMGARFDLLGISQVAALMGNGIMDQSDAIDARISLDAVYLAFPAAGSPAVQGAAVKFDLSKQSRTNFTKTNEGHYKEMGLQFQTRTLQLNAATRAVDASTPAQLSGISTYTIFLAVNVDGRINTETGETNVYASAVTVDSIVDATGASVDPLTGAGATLVAALGAISIKGYDLRAYRTNSNRRTRGLILDTAYQTARYTIPLGSPISAPSPITSSRDASDLKSLVTASRIRNSNNAVTSLIAYANALLTYVAGPASPNAHDWNPYDQGIQGMGKYLVRPFFMERNLDLTKAINSISASDRAADISATIVSEIRNVAYLMYQQSRIQAALDAVSGNPDERPVLLVGTDQVLIRHLIVAGDTRTFGQYFDGHQIEASMDLRVYSKIFLAFGRKNGQGPDPLQFGTHAWVPELVSSVAVNRNGSTIKEAMVQPRTLHINNLPIMAVINVSGLETVLAESTVLLMDSVSGITGVAATGSNIAPGSAFVDGTGTTGQSSAV